MKSIIGCCVYLVCSAFAATGQPRSDRGQTNPPARPPQPVHLVTRIGECESRIGAVEVVVAAMIEREKATVRIRCRLNQADTACEMDSSNAVPVAQILQNVSSELMKGKLSAAQHQNVEVDSFALEDKKLVEIIFHRGDSTAGESTCRLWFDSYNALGLSRLILSGKAVADWLEPRLVSLE